MLNYLLSFELAVFSIVYVKILTDQDMILFWWWKFLHKHIKSDYILKPVVDCEYCVAGQLALWVYPFTHNYNFMFHILFITMTIFMVEIYNVWQGK